MRKFFLPSYLTKKKTVQVGNVLSSQTDGNRENTADVMVKCFLMCSYLPQPPFYFFLPFTDSLKRKYLYNTKTERMYKYIPAKKQDPNVSMQTYIKI